MGIVVVSDVGEASVAAVVVTAADGIGTVGEIEDIEAESSRRAFLKAGWDSLTLASRGWRAVRASFNILDT